MSSPLPFPDILVSPLPGSWKFRFDLANMANKARSLVPITDIVVSKGSVYQMTSKEKKGLDWVMSETKYLLMLTLLKKVLL